MLNFPIFRRTVRTEGRRWLVCTGILILQMMAALGMYASGGGTGRLLARMPEWAAALLGIERGAGTLTEYLASCMFGFFYPVTAAAYAVITADRLMAKKIESGTMAYLLSSPNKRGTIADTQGSFLVISLFAMFLCSFVVGMFGCVLSFPGELDILQFMLLHLGAFCLELCLGGIAFMISCIVNESRRALGIAAGVLALFLVLHMISGMGGVLGVLRFATVFTLFDTSDVINGSLGICLKFPLLAIAGLIFISLGRSMFSKRDLPL